MEDEGNDGGNEGNQDDFDGHDGDDGDNSGDSGERGGWGSDSGGWSGERGERSSFSERGEVSSFSLTRERESPFHFEMSKEYNEFMGREKATRNYFGYNEKFRGEINESKQAVREAIEGTGIIDFEQMLKGQKLIICLDGSAGLTAADVLGGTFFPSPSTYETIKEILNWVAMGIVGYMVLRGIGKPIARPAAELTFNGTSKAGKTIGYAVGIMDIAAGFREGINKANARRMDRCMIQSIQK
ncbi:hypothetical protein [Dyadobacter sp. BHUBP1]|uniref:hypothetical protein n=1 Tax=Dyadobacter sp. BHUBP1 TaxID=3424178 RepID=UPI003D344CDE